MAREPLMILVDFKKVQTLDDMRLILGALGIQFSTENPNFHLIARFLDESSLQHARFADSILSVPAKLPRPN